MMTAPATSANPGPSPFHRGELQVQSRVGAPQSLDARARRVVRPYLPEQHREFFRKLPFVVVAAQDAAGRPWVTLLTGQPGFVQSPGADSLVIAAHPSPGDALEFSLLAGAPLGLLGIELETRRRNRVNGRIAASGPSGMEFKVDQSFGNCPQYITRRSWEITDVARQAPSTTRSAELTRMMQHWVRSADTFFIGSGYREAGASQAVQGMDASHRGGPPGFVEVHGSTRLVFPDFSGNNHFNTIGNLVINPAVGLLFVDFTTASLLQISGSAQIDWDSPEVGKRPGAQRLVVVDIHSVLLHSRVLPLRWSMLKLQRG